MWTMTHSLDAIVRGLAPAFTQPSFTTTSTLLLAWLMCLGKHRLCRVAQSASPQTLPDHSQRHGFDTFYNYYPGMNVAQESHDGIWLCLEGGRHHGCAAARRSSVIR